MKKILYLCNLIIGIDLIISVIGIKSEYNNNYDQT